MIDAIPHVQYLGSSSGTTAKASSLTTAMPAFSSSGRGRSCACSPREFPLFFWAQYKGRGLKQGGLQAGQETAA